VVLFSKFLGVRGIIENENDARFDCLSCCLVVLFLLAPLLRAQDLSKYRHFTIGMNLSRALERTGQKMTHDRPALIQDLPWWPPNRPGPSFQADPVEQILLSFYNGELYKISVTYDRTFTEGLTAEDMVKSISEKYGPVKNTMLDSAKIDRYDVRQKPIATWEDAQYSFNLVRFSSTDCSGLTIYSKRVKCSSGTCHRGCGETRGARSPKTGSRPAEEAIGRP
jgi:hypothetical protein